MSKERAQRSFVSSLTDSKSPLVLREPKQRHSYYKGHHDQGSQAKEKRRQVQTPIVT